MKVKKSPVARSVAKGRLEQLDGLSLLVVPAKRDRWQEIMGKAGEISDSDLQEIILMLTPEGAAAVSEYVKSLQPGKFSTKALLEKFSSSRFSPMLLRRMGRR